MYWFYNFTPRSNCIVYFLTIYCLTAHEIWGIYNFRDVCPLAEGAAISFQCPRTFWLKKKKEWSVGRDSEASHENDLWIWEWLVWEGQKYWRETRERQFNDSFKALDFTHRRLNTFKFWRVRINMELPVCEQWMGYEILRESLPWSLKKWSYFHFRLSFFFEGEGKGHPAFHFP